MAAPRHSIRLIRSHGASAAHDEPSPDEPWADAVVGWAHAGGLELVDLPTRADLALVGTFAPPHWLGAAVITGGSIRGGSDAPPAPVFVVADRAGRGPVAITEAHPHGLVVEPGPLPDALLRFLRRRTPAAPERPSALAHRIWLHRVLAAALVSDRPDRLGWPYLMALHPAWRFDPRSVGLAHAATIFDGRDGWRRLAVEADDPSLTPAGSLDWFDRGSFGRWCAVRLPEVVEMVDDLEHLLDPAIWRSVVDVVGVHPTRIRAERRGTEV